MVSESEEEVEPPSGRAEFDDWENEGFEDSGAAAAVGAALPDAEVAAAAGAALPAPVSPRTRRGIARAKAMGIFPCVKRKLVDRSRRNAEANVASASTTHVVEGLARASKRPAENAQTRMEALRARILLKRAGDLGAPAEEQP